MQCEHHHRVNFYRANAVGCVVTRLGDAILNLSKVNCQKWKFNLVCQFRVNKVFGQIFQPVENSSLPCERSLNNNSHVHHTFLYISFPSMQDYHVKIPNLAKHATCTFPTMRLICHPKFCISVVFNFSWEDCNTREKWKNKGHTKFWGANEVHYGKCGSGECLKGSVSIRSHRP